MRPRINIWRWGRIVLAGAAAAAFAAALWTRWLPVKKLFRTQAASDLLALCTEFSLGAGAALLGILLVTLLFGRFYCSVLCPLGILQDVMSLFRFRRHYRYTGWKNKVRRVVFFVVAGMALSGFMLPLILLLPSSNFVSMLNAFGRVAGERLGFGARLVGWGMFVLLFVSVLWKGRLFCNTLCPVGALLALCSKTSRYRIVLDAEKCVRCGACEKVCKSTCIDSANKSVNTDECVMCMNCLGSCRLGAISIKKQPFRVCENLPERREFLKDAGLLGGGIAVGVLGRLTGNRCEKYPVMPPGAGSFDRFTSRCVGCGLCIAACKGKVLKPAMTEYGLRGFLQPVLDPVKGACDFNCAKCTHICPCGALTPLKLAEKRRTRIGLAVYEAKLCVAYADGEDCGACAEHCPVGALEMVAYKDTMIPKVNKDLCIGCGACQNICPVRPQAAISVVGVSVQTVVDKPLETKSKKLSAEADFPF